MKRFALSILFILMFCSPTCVKAQLDSLVYSPETPKLEAEGKNELRVTVDAMTFFRDNEYNSKHLIKGYTLPGVWLSPQ